MGFFDDLGRLADASAKQPRPGLRDSVKQAADGAEAAQQYQANGGGFGGLGSNPFANAAAYNSAIAGSGEILALTDTGQVLAESHIYDVKLRVTVDGREPYEVVHRQVLAAGVLGAWQPGKVIALRVDAVDPTQVMLG